MSQDICSSCGNKITETQTYYYLDIVDRLRLVCKTCFKELTKYTDEEIEEMEKEKDDSRAENETE